MMVEEIVISGNEIECAEKVRQVWNEADTDFVARLRNNNFTLFFSGKPPRTTPAGELVYLAKRGTADNIYWPTSDSCYLEDTYLLKSEINEYIKKFPYLLYPIAEVNKSITNNNENTQKLKTENISPDNLQERWTLSPLDLVSRVNEYKIPTYYYDYERLETIHTLYTSNLHEVFFHILDIEKFESEHPELFQDSALAQAQKQIGHLESKIKKWEAWNTEKLREIHALKAGTTIKAVEAELAKSVQKIADLESEIASLKEATPTRSRTTNATEKNQDRAAKRWAGYLRTAVKLALHCVEKNCQFTKRDLKTACEREGFGDLTDDALTAFKDAMPDTLVKKVPGAPKQGE